MRDGGETERERDRQTDRQRKIKMDHCKVQPSETGSDL